MYETSNGALSLTSLEIQFLIPWVEGTSIRRYCPSDPGPLLFPPLHSESRVSSCRHPPGVPTSAPTPISLPHTPTASLGPTIFLLGPEFLHSSYSLPASAPCLVSRAVRMREGFEERGKAADTSSKIIYACKCLCGKASFVLEGHEGGV